ncbi:MAG TPA: dihydrolipoamide acetyltransferase family protein [Candidatus Binataceae bacterium]|nr:dihydrolipoamide acetyltransferase family protein [Candidatus Binataceae bacterium]
MSLEVTMPQMGESVVEGTVTKWLVKVGDQVKEDQPLCEISTDKVDTEIPSPGAGVITQLIAIEGQVLPIGAPLALIDAAGAGTGTAARPSPPTSPQSSPPTRPVSRPVAAVAPPAPRRLQAVPAAALASAEASAPARTLNAPHQASLGAPQAMEGAPVVASAPRRYSPVVLKMAEEQAIDLSLVPGTGIGGRVSKRDVERYLEALRSGRAPVSQTNGVAAHPVSNEPTPTGAPAPSAAAPVATPAHGPTFRPPVYQPREGDMVEPFTRRRKLIAEHMVYSKTHSPHVGTVAEVDLTRLSALREKHKKDFQSREGFSLTLLPFAAMATIQALKEFPRMNAAVVGDSAVIRRDINLGIAMDAPDGLLVPVIKQADTFTVVGLAREMERLRQKVAAKSITADDLGGGSFTLSNPGREGNLYGFAIINQPQVGILRMGEVKKRPVVIELDGADAIAIRTMMYLALSYDHRVIDGVLGNRFLFHTARLLEEANFEL